MAEDHVKRCASHPVAIQHHHELVRARTREGDLEVCDGVATTLDATGYVVAEETVRVVEEQRGSAVWTVDVDCDVKVPPTIS